MKEGAQARPGGRTARTRDAVLAATLAEMSEHGYGGLSVEAVAERAGVHKTTVYRRWATKASLVVDAVSVFAQSSVGVPDTGDFAEDLRLLAQAIRLALSGRDGGGVVRALFSGASEAPEVRALLHRFWAVRLSQVRPIVERALARGELPAGTDPDEVFKHLCAPLYSRLLVTAEPITPDAADRAAAAAYLVARAGILVLPPVAP
ncbi:TetR/AcrR family transcriptional regulator [Jidongwangia harbinensis]|uniref:TetR/AcrR family transcriptional regulator n=1 Tax=Jidongwangia harbinensis TaxID=2878561 RepID=UPI001CD9F98E|nr:TetR/AcrR family transcriptional regulator [Jidongwangia harbinensis]MCA2216677.1 TetR/AcrR family transcriptional regulator [Jidongwangia harbinensis]